MRSSTLPEDYAPDIKQRGYTDSNRASEDTQRSGINKFASSTPLCVTLPGSSVDEIVVSQSRSRVVQAKLKEYEERIRSTRSQLDAEMRVVRNLALLTPFQRSTRNRLQLAVANLGKTVRQLRLEIVKTTCYRDVLTTDLASEEREKIRQKKSVQREGLHAETTVPRMTLSIHEDDGLHESSVESLSHSDLTDLSTGRPESSICESFHSALDINPGWQVDNSISAGSLPRQGERSTSPAARKDCSEVGPPLPTSEQSILPTRGSTEHQQSRTSHDHSNSNKAVQHTSDSTGDDEQAEEWHKTRAAKRVSLVKVPHSLSVIARHDGRRTEIRTDKAGPSAIPETDDLR